MHLNRKLLEFQCNWSNILNNNISKQTSPWEFVSGGHAIRIHQLEFVNCIMGREILISKLI